MSKRSSVKSDNIKVELAYEPSSEADLRLFKALSMAINEEDIFNYFQKREGEGFKQKTPLSSEAKGST